MKAKKAIKKVPVKTAKKVQESGHAKNVSNLGTLISAAVSFGTPYNPANPKQTITSMQTIFTNGTNDKNAVFTALKPYQDAISKRAVDFRKAKTFLSRIVGAAKSLELSDDSILKIKATSAKSAAPGLFLLSFLRLPILQPNPIRLVPMLKHIQWLKPHIPT